LKRSTVNNSLFAKCVQKSAMKEIFFRHHQIRLYKKKKQLLFQKLLEDHASRNPRAPYRPQSPCWSRALSQQRRGARKKDEQFNKARECETKILKTVTIFFYAFKIAHCL
jgi:hypothetical protein